MSEDASAGHKADKVPEYRILLLGTAHKKPLFDKICEAAEKYEKHVQYNDTYYLHFTIDGQQCIVELSDPGVEHTGAREMAVRKADAVILSYAAHNATSFHKLTNIAEDFKLRKKYPPIVMISNEDEVLATDDEVPSTADSTSEGYGSDETPPHPHSSEGESPGSPRRRPSMENIRNSLEDSPITSEQGETMAKLFGPECEFLSMRFSEYAEAGDLIKSMSGAWEEGFEVAGGSATQIPTAAWASLHQVWQREKNALRSRRGFNFQRRVAITNYAGGRIAKQPHR
ncbi:hypothetical protein AAVH_03183 [Aphelenchoides avenae]|nr:hypothetical protein AAVH_03183 [Aphelenchus avenae]